MSSFTTTLLEYCWFIVMIAILTGLPLLLYLIRRYYEYTNNHNAFYLKLQREVLYQVSTKRWKVIQHVMNTSKNNSSDADDIDDLETSINKTSNVLHKQQQFVDPHFTELDENSVEEKLARDKECIMHRVSGSSPSVTEAATLDFSV